MQGLRCPCRSSEPAQRTEGRRSLSLPVATRNMLSDQPLGYNELKYQNDALLEVEVAQRVCARE